MSICLWKSATVYIINAKTKIWGYLVKKYGVIPIVRQKLNTAITSMDKLEEAIKKGTSMMIAPEGTRTLTGKLGPFKKGAFHVAKNTNKFLRNYKK